MYIYIYLRAPLSSLCAGSSSDADKVRASLEQLSRISKSLGTDDSEFIMEGIDFDDADAALSASERSYATGAAAAGAARLLASGAASSATSTALVTAGGSGGGTLSVAERLLLCGQLSNNKDRVQRAPPKTPPR